MNLTHYNKLLTQPKNFAPEDLQGLDAIVAQFPFFQSAQALRLKILKQQESLGYNQALKKTAAATTDRDVLFDYITSAEFSQQTISETLIGHQDHVKQIEVNLDLQDNVQKAQADESSAMPSEEDTLAVETERKAISALEEKPFEFDKSERHSFEQWLKLTSAQPIRRSSDSNSVLDHANNQGEQEQHPLDTEFSEPAKVDESVDKWEKIDRFLAQKTSVKPQDAEVGQNRAETYLQSHEELMTETLARVYAQQKNYQKAIQAYKILSLKYPEKSSFFADQIQELKRLLNA